MWPRQRRRLRILRGPGLSGTLFPSWEKRWRWWRTTDEPVTLRNWTSWKRRLALCWGLLCAGDCSGAPRDGFWEKDVAQTAQHNVQHFPCTTYWSDSRVFSLGGSFNCALIRTATGSHSCPARQQDIMTPHCAWRGGLSSEWQCTMHILYLICTVRAISQILNLYSIFFYLVV